MERLEIPRGGNFAAVWRLAPGIRASQSQGHGCGKLECSSADFGPREHADGPVHRPGFSPLGAALTRLGSPRIDTSRCLLLLGRTGRKRPGSGHRRRAKLRRGLPALPFLRSSLRPKRTRDPLPRIRTRRCHPQRQLSLCGRRLTAGARDRTPRAGRRRSRRRRNRIRARPRTEGQTAEPAAYWGEAGN